MKLIIDIDEQHFELIQMAVMNGMGNNAQKIIAQGIPLEQMLEQIRAEILSLPTVVWNMVRRTRVFEIIDKYKEEQEDNSFFDEIMDDESDGEVYEKIKEIIAKVKEQEK